MAVVLNGLDQYLKVDMPGGISSMQDMTFFCVFETATPVTHSAGNQMIVGTHSSASAYTMTAIRALSADDSIQGRQRAHTSFEELSSGPVLSPATVYNVCMRWKQSTGETTLQINGGAIIPSDNPSASAPTLYDVHALVVGTSFSNTNFSTSGDLFKGRVQNVGLWVGEHLTDDQSTELTTLTTAPDALTTSPDYYYPLISNLDSGIGGTELTAFGSPTFDDVDLGSAPSTPTKIITVNNPYVYTAPTTATDSNSLFAGQYYSAGSMFWFEFTGDNANKVLYDAADTEAQGLWANDINDWIIPETGFSGDIDVSLYVWDFDTSTTASTTGTVSVVEDVIVGDFPVITLTGDNPMSLPQATPYSEPGFTVTDTEDGDLTGSLTPTGTVDHTTVGSYPVTYSITDSNGNTTTVVRTVNVTDTELPVITLIGNAAISVTLNSTYTDQGANVSDNVDAGSVLVAQGSVDTSTLGPYTLTYDYTDAAGNAAVTVTRTVTVVNDSTIPVITLLGSTPVTIEAGTTYSDAGATATDNVDGDITGDIVPTSTVNSSLPGSYSVTYNVNDSSGNSATPVVRVVEVVDTTKPVITLIGNSSITLELNDTYNDAGTTVTDNVDATTNVAATGSVDTSTPGTYTLTYDYTDAAGNVADQVSRTVIVNASAIGSISTSLVLPTGGVPQDMTGLTMVIYATAEDQQKNINQIETITDVSVTSGNVLVDTFVATAGNKHIRLFDPTDYSAHAYGQITVV